MGFAIITTLSELLFYILLPGWKKMRLPFDARTSKGLLVFGLVSTALLSSGCRGTGAVPTAIPEKTAIQPLATVDLRSVIPPVQSLPQTVDIYQAPSVYEKVKDIYANERFEEGFFLGDMKGAFISAKDSPFKNWTDINPQDITRSDNFRVMSYRSRQIEIDEKTGNSTFSKTPIWDFNFTKVKEDRLLANNIAVYPGRYGDELRWIIILPNNGEYIYQLKSKKETTKQGNVIQESKIKADEMIISNAVSDVMGLRWVADSSLPEGGKWQIATR